MALTACRIDLARRRIEVVEAITEVHGRVIIGTTKTHQRRSGPIPRSLPTNWRTAWPGARCCFRDWRGGMGLWKT